MALIDCYECGRQISTEAPACPQCGAPSKQSAPQIPPSVSHPIPPHEEEVLHNDVAVTISTARVMIYGTTYALRNITSVRMAVTPASVGGPVLIILFGLVMLLFSIGLFGDEEFVGSGFICLAVAVLLVTAGIMLVRRAKTSYHVAITSSSGELNALSSKDRRYIETVVYRINEAIVRYR